MPRLFLALFNDQGHLFPLLLCSHNQTPVWGHWVVVLLLKQLENLNYEDAAAENTAAACDNKNKSWFHPVERNILIILHHSYTKYLVINLITFE